MLIVYEYILDADVVDLDDLQEAVDSLHDTALAPGTEQDRLAVHEVDHHLVALVLLGDLVVNLNRYLFLQMYSWVNVVSYPINALCVTNANGI